MLEYRTPELYRKDATCAPMKWLNEPCVLPRCILHPVGHVPWEFDAVRAKTPLMYSVPTPELANCIAKWNQVLAAIFVVLAVPVPANHAEIVPSGSTAMYQCLFMPAQASTASTPINVPHADGSVGTLAHPSIVQDAG